MKYLWLPLFLFLSSCEVERIEGIPSLNPPLGVHVEQVGTDGIGIYFHAYNRESYFYGYTIFISTRREDFTQTSERVFGVDPRSLTGNQVRLLTNSNPIETAVSLKESIMSRPQTEPFVYPRDAQTTLGVVDPSNPTITNFLTTSLKSLPPRPDGTDGGALFIAGTTYYFAVYSYAAVNLTEQRFSLPSEIIELTFK
ncbi:MAG: hypothetical protein ACRCVW_04880 [Brevinema sp.]